MVKRSGVKILFNVYSFDGCVGMTSKFWCHLTLWWEKKETWHFVLNFGKIALSKLLQNGAIPFIGAAPLKAHLDPKDPVRLPYLQICSFPQVRLLRRDCFIAWHCLRPTTITAAFRNAAVNAAAITDSHVMSCNFNGRGFICAAKLKDKLTHDLGGASCVA